MSSFNLDNEIASTSSKISQYFNKLDNPSTIVLPDTYEMVLQRYEEANSYLINLFELSQNQREAGKQLC
jgi:hypothetical protein